MYTSETKGYIRRMTSDTPAESADLASRDPQPQFWHVYGAPHPGATSGKNNYNVITYGPSVQPPSPKLAETPFPYAGFDHAYLATFDHDPTAEEKNALKPEAYRS